MPTCACSSSRPHAPTTTPARTQQSLVRGTVDAAYGHALTEGADMMVSSASSSRPISGTSSKSSASVGFASARRPISAIARPPSSAPSMTGSASSLVRGVVQQTLVSATHVGVEMADSRPASGYGG